MRRGPEVASVSNRVRLQWRVPSSTWSLFREYVEDEYGRLDGYLGREVEVAMQEHIGRDGYETVEDMVDELVKAAGRSPDRVIKRTKRGSEDTTNVTPRVAEQLKDDFRAHVDGSDMQNSYGEELAEALEFRMDGGRARRLEEKLDRVLDDATTILSDVRNTETGEASDDEGLGYKERQTIAICHRLRELESTEELRQFKDETLEQAISDVAADNPIASDPTLNRYKPRVTERLEMEPHPNNPEVWITRERAKDLTPEGTPEIVRKPVGFLDKLERVKRTRLVVGKQAAQLPSGETAVSTDHILGDVLENGPTRPTVLDDMNTAAKAPGFEVREIKGEKRLTVDLDEVASSRPDLYDEIIAYRDGESEDLIEGGDSSIGDYTSAEQKADAQLAALGQATAATDGGAPVPGE